MRNSEILTFKESEYKERISHYETERLRKQEVVKTRQEFSAAATIGSGIGGAAFTCGASLAMTGYGARRMYVAKKKLELIQAELSKRGIELHKVQKRDFFIPAAAHLLGGVVGFGLDEVVMGATNTIPLGEHIPTGASAIHEVLTNPHEALQGVVSGIEEQGREMWLAVNGATNGVIPGSDLSSEILAAHTEWIAAPISDVIGFHEGMLIAHGAERSVASLVGSQCGWWVMESMSGFQQKAVQRLPCQRMLGSMVQCDHCAVKLEAGMYWHCCACHDDFDICEDCHSSGKRCRSPEHELDMKTLQVAYHTDFILNTQLPEGYLCEAKLNQTTSRSAFATGDYPIFWCYFCDDEVTQGLWFHCSQCAIVDICAPCYFNGQHCPSSSHRLEVRLCAIDCSPNPRWVRDCRRQNMILKGISCSHCKKSIPQGRHYHCCNCDDDNFDLCHSCYSSCGIRCRVPSKHTLQLNLVSDATALSQFKGTCKRKGRATKTFAHITCSRCTGTITTGYFWHCCVCAEDDFDLCLGCYRGRKGCDDYRHVLTIHTM